MNKLIIIRGNSGSGKSIVAEELRNTMNGKVALIGQDTLRRTILMETDSAENIDILGLMKQTVIYCLDNGYNVILEGILSRPKYGDLLGELMDYEETKSHVFYIDVSLEETIQRHKTKPIASEVSDEKLKEWYQEKNYLEFENEVIIPEESSLQETVGLILSKVNQN